MKNLEDYTMAIHANVHLNMLNKTDYMKCIMKKDNELNYLDVTVIKKKQTN